MRCIDIIDFFWPILEKNKKLNSEKFKISKKDITVSNTHLDTTLRLTQSCHEAEDKRKSSVESKSIVFIGAVGFIIAILIGITKDLIIKPSMEINSFSLGAIFILLLIVIYFCRAVWFAVKALESKVYSYLVPKEIINSSKTYIKDLIVKINNVTAYNFNVNNEKVDNMTMAQKNFKRGIVLVVIYSIYFFCGGIITKCPNLQKIITSLQNLGSYITARNQSLLILLLIVLFVWCFILTIKYMKLKKEEH